MKKTLAMLTALIMAVSMSVSAFAAGSGEAAGSSYTYSGNKLSNEFLGVELGSGGNFQLVTTGGDPMNDRDDDQCLTYDTSTSYTTFVVDGEFNGSHYNFNSFETVQDTVADEENGTLVTVKKFGDIQIKQTLSFVNNISTNRMDVIEIRYDATNTGSTTHNVGTRIMLDTMLGNNDHAPFRIPGIGNVTTEMEFSGDDIPQYFQAFDSLSTPTVIAQGSFLRTSTNRPDRVQFGNWRRMSRTPWNYSVTPGDSNGDSAIAVIWDGVDIPARETRTFTTYYGLSDLSQSVEGPLAASFYADTVFSYQFDENDNVLYDSADVTAYLENVSDEDMTNVYATLELPEGFSFVVDEPDEDTTDEETTSDETEAGDPSTYTIDILNPNDPQQVSWVIAFDPDVVEPGTYPLVLHFGSDSADEQTLTRYITVPVPSHPENIEPLPDPDSSSSSSSTGTNNANSNPNTGSAVATAATAAALALAGAVVIKKRK